VPRVQAGENVLICGHRNSFRPLWTYIERVPGEAAMDMQLPPASAPLVYEFEDLGEGHGLIFKAKYPLAFPNINPRLGSGAKVHGKAYFLRHAESTNNARGIDNGWEDSTLTLKGEQQAREAGVCLKARGVKVDIIFTSALQRAVKTAELACMVSNNAFDVPVIQSWKLNARHSGALHGCTWAEAVEQYGDAAAEFRTAQGAPPAFLAISDPRHPANDPLYANVPQEELPCGESFDLMAKRVLQFWNDSIMPHIREGKSVLVVAHRNPLKAILEHLNDDREKGMFDAQVRSTLPFVNEFGVGDPSGGPVVMTRYSLSSFTPQMSQALKTVGKAVFLRHGESDCNLNERFTGWENSMLTPKGEQQAVEAGRYLLEEGYKFDVVFTSVLARALDSVERVCKESGNPSVPVVKSWRLNARHPGVLQGLTKMEAVRSYGKIKVDLWRGSYDVMPECVSEDDPRHPVNDALYAGVPPEQLPSGGESLAKVVDRIVPFWTDHIVPRILAGESVLIVGHQNSLKALFMYLEDTAGYEMFDVRPVSTTVPMVFEFGTSGQSRGPVIVKKYWVKHTETEALAKSKCPSQATHM